MNMNELSKSVHYFLMSNEVALCSLDTDEIQVTLSVRVSQERRDHQFEKYFEMLKHLIISQKKGF